jgi:hypothetical protein
VAGAQFDCGSRGSFQTRWTGVGIAYKVHVVYEKKDPVKPTGTQRNRIDVDVSLSRSQTRSVWVRLQHRATVPYPSMLIPVFSRAYCGLVFWYFNSSIDRTASGPPKLSGVHQSFKFNVSNPNGVTQTHETVFWNQALANPRID